MKILIIAFYFPPEDTWAKMASLRPHSWAKYWSRLGHQVYVLTAHRPGLERTGNPALVGVKYWPSRPVKSLQPTSEFTADDRFKPRMVRLLKRGLKTLRQRLGLGSFLQTSDFWLLPAFDRALRLHLSVNFDLVVSTYGPPANHIIGSYLKQRTGVFWVADYRDLWHGNDYVSINPILSKTEAWLENRCVAPADLITSVSQGISDELRVRFGTDVATIENGFDLEELGYLPVHQWPEPKIRLLYTGTLYPGRQETEALWVALKYLKSSYPNLEQTLDVIFYGWNLASLRAKVKEYSLSSLVHLYDPRPRHEILAMQRSADALIFFDWKQPSVNGILTGKLFEYLFAGRPIIGIGSTSYTAAGQLMVELGVGHLVDNNPKAITVLLEQLLRGEPLVYTPQPEKMQRYTREYLANTMLAIIQSRMAKRAVVG